MTGPLGALLGLGLVFCAAAVLALTAVFTSYAGGEPSPRWHYWLMLAAVPGAMLVGYVAGATS